MIQLKYHLLIKKLHACSFPYFLQQQQQTHHSTHQRSNEYPRMVKRTERVHRSKQDK